jgi:hypothetical protein
LVRGDHHRVVGLIERPITTGDNADAEPGYRG